MRGVVMKSTGSWYDVLGEDGKRYQARVRGKIRLEGIRETNPVAVGEYVELDSEANITTILPRDNYISRKAVKKGGHTQVIAANVDQTLVVVSLSFPRTSLGFIDRFLVASESFRIPQIIVFNKADLFEEDHKEAIRICLSIYEPLGVKCIVTSALNDEQTELKRILKGKKTLISGHSGAGKSTLINKLSDQIRQRTSEVSDFTSKGTHTTTFAEMFQIDEDTFVIDTPGIKEMGIIDMRPEEISDYFVEMRDLRLQCKFGARCLHVNEPKCAIVEAVENGKIALSRYESYLSILSGDDNRN